MLSDTARAESAEAREVALAERYLVRSFVAPMALVFAFAPGICALILVPAFGTHFTSHPELATVIGQCKLLFVLVSVLSVFAWRLLVLRRRGGALLALLVMNAGLAALQVWAVFPAGVWHSGH